MTNYLYQEPTYIVICYAVGQTALLYITLYGLFYGADRLITTWWRRRKARKSETA